MRNITFSADANLIEKAHSVARAQGTTLNAVFRDWLEQFIAGNGDAQNFDALMRQMRHVNAGGHYTRDEMNER